MYTNAANLQHTIALQQNLFQQQLAERQRLATSIGVQLGVPSPAAAADTAAGHPLLRSAGMQTVPCQTASSDGKEIDDVAVDGTRTGTGGVPMEWVVKRRSDGTRYITRRPRSNGKGATTATAAAATVDGQHLQQQQQQQQQQQAAPAASASETGDDAARREGAAAGNCAAFGA
jgi:hypothetical protein